MRKKAKKQMKDKRTLSRRSIAKAKARRIPFVRKLGANKEAYATLIDSYIAGSSISNR